MKRNETEQSPCSNRPSGYAVIAAALLAAALSGCATPSVGEGENFASVDLSSYSRIGEG
jgi:hypothetical protein